MPGCPAKRRQSLQKHVLFYSKIVQAVAQTVADLQFINMTILFRPFGLLPPKDFKIIWLSNLFTMNVPDEGYSNLFTMNVPDEGYSNLFTMNLPDEGYSNLFTMNVPDEGYSNLFTMNVPDEGYSNLFTMNVPDEGYSRKVLCTLS